MPSRDFKTHEKFLKSLELEDKKLLHAFVQTILNIVDEREPPTREILADIEKFRSDLKARHRAPTEEAKFVNNYIEKVDKILTNKLQDIQDKLERAVSPEGSETLLPPIDGASRVLRRRERQYQEDSPEAVRAEETQALADADAFKQFLSQWFSSHPPSAESTPAPTRPTHLPPMEHIPILPTPSSDGEPHRTRRAGARLRAALDDASSNSSGTTRDSEHDSQPPSPRRPS